MEVLLSAEWATYALMLLKHCGTLDLAEPAVMFIRHTARPEIKDIQGVSDISASPEGLEAARGFGAALPHGRYYRIYHGEAVRCTETAEAIVAGIKENGGEAELRGIPIFLEKHPHLDLPRSVERMMREGMRSWYANWVSGRYSPTEMEPSLDFAKRAAAEMLQSLGDALPKCFEIYVSHDTWTQALLFHWFGAWLDIDRINPLEGFVFQLKQEKMAVHYRDQSREVDYPYWWEQVSVRRTAIHERKGK